MRPFPYRTLIGLLWLGTVAGLGIACRPKAAATATRLHGEVLSLSDETIGSERRDTFRFGTLRHGEQVVRDFIVKNTGSRPFVIAEVDSDCGCIATRCAGVPLQAGDSTSLSVSFDSRGYYGYILKEVRILTSLDARPYIFFMEAEVK